MIALLALLAGSATAQDVGAPAVNAQMYRMPVDARLTMATDDSSWAPGSYAMGRLVLSYANDPIQYTYADGEVVDVLSDLVQANAIAGLSFGRVRVGVDVPLTLAAMSDVSGGGAGIGDIAIDIKGNALDRGKWGSGLAFGLRANVPTNRVDASIGESTPNVELQAIADRRFGNGFLAGNLGGRITAIDGTRNTQWLVRPFARVGAGYLFTNNAGASLDLVGYGSQTFPLEAPSGAPVEYIAGGWYRTGRSLVLRGGIGRGVTRAVGSPRARLVASIGYEPPRELDSDLDAIMDRIDECPFEAEDRDEFEDLDGCPDFDNDGDGVLDRFDNCTLEVEDIDGFEDSDGCPEAATEAHLRVNGPDGRALTDAKITVTGAGITPRWGGGDYRVVLEPGSYTMSAEAPGYKPYEATIEVVDGKSLERIGTMQAEDPKGTLQLVVFGSHGREVRGAMVAADGGAFEPVAGELSLAAGPYRKHVRAPGFGTTELVVRISADETKSLTIDLPDSRAVVVDSAVNLSEAVVFPVGGAELDDGGSRVLDDLAGLLIDDAGLELLITGHGDSGETDALRALGERRAKAVKDYIVSRGVSGARVRITGAETPPPEGAASIVVTVETPSE